MQENAMTIIYVRPETKAALENLFVILHITGSTWDARLYELAERAFTANQDVSANVKTLRERSANGMKKYRKRVDIKEETYWRLRELHGRMFPYLPWTSWDWHLNEMADAVEDGLHETRQEVHMHEDPPQDGG